uniref:Uncharacterized protein n=1 Tax=Arundo donax TaxID=35708 RepID=A0A0A8Z5V3_ARUDO
MKRIHNRLPGFVLCTHLSLLILCIISNSMSGW